MFGALMEEGFSNNVISCLIVTKELSSLWMENLEVGKEKMQPCKFLTCSNIYLFSASIEDVETIDGFLYLHEIREVPRKRQ